MNKDQIYFGEIVDGQQLPNGGLDFLLSEELLHTHLAIFGGTRQGKSKLFEQICRELVRLRRGFAFIDPHSDTADDILAFLAHHHQALGIQKNNIHYLNPFEKLFAFDPFYYESDPTDPVSETRAGYLEWLHAKVLDVERIITRVLGETEADSKKQVRMHRWMRGVLYAIGIRDENSGEHLGLSDALILLNPDDARFPYVLGKVAPLLSHGPIVGTADDGFDVGPDILTDLQMMASVRDPVRREGWVESSINRLREILSPIVRRIFSPSSQRIDFRRIIASGGIILAPLGKRRRFHQIDGQVIAGLIIREIADAVATAERDQRNRYYLFIDEAQNFIGEDLMHLFKESGKYKLSIGIAVQTLDNLVFDKIDLTPTVLGMCGIRITFQQQHKPYAEILAGDLGYPLVDFTPLVHETLQHSHYDFIVTPSISEGVTVGESQTQTTGSSTSLAYGQTQGTSSAFTETFGVTDTAGRSHSDGASFVQSHGDSIGHTNSSGVTQGLSEAESSQIGNAHSNTNTVGSSDAVSGSVTNGKSAAESNSTGSSYSTGDSSQKSVGQRVAPGQDLVTQNNDGSAVSNNRSDSSNRSETRTLSQQETRGETHTDSGSMALGNTVNESSGNTVTRNQSTKHDVGNSRTATDTIARGTNSSDTNSESQAIQRAVSEALSISQGQSVTETTGHQHSHSIGNSRSNSHSVTLSVTPLARYKTVQQRTGQLVTSLETQDRQLTVDLQSLSQQHCFVCVGQLSVSSFIRIANVYDKFEERGVDDEWKQAVIDGFKQHIFSVQPYYFDRDSALQQRTKQSIDEPPENPLTP